MPSQANTKQSLISAITEGLCIGLLAQGETDPVFMGVYSRIKRINLELGQILKSEPGGQMDGKDLDRIARMFQEFQKLAPGIDGLSDAKAGVSMLIGLIGDQLAYVKPGRKRALLLELQGEMENLLWLYDPNGEYDSPEGMEAADAFYAAVA